ncbi:hypothetical protein U1Q18_046882 [Sarracenia purpurea var. burkii]
MLVQFASANMLVFGQSIGSIWPGLAQLLLVWLVLCSLALSLLADPFGSFLALLIPCCLVLSALSRILGVVKKSWMPFLLLCYS